MKNFVFNDSESKTLLDMADILIEKGLVKENYEIDKINEVINYGYENVSQGFEVEIEIKFKQKSSDVSTGNTACDVTTLRKGDVVHYYNRDKGTFLIDKGVLKEDNLYSDGVEVHGDGWKQYVSKWFICKVERGNDIVFEKQWGI